MAFATACPGTALATGMTVTKCQTDGKAQHTLSKPMNKILVTASIAFAGLLAACEPVDTTALREIENTVTQARETVELANARSDEIRQTLENPVGALQAMAGAQLVRTPTDQPGIFVLTDATTGCQFLATYDAAGRTHQSITPRTMPAEAGPPVQRCVPLDTVSQLAGQAAAAAAGQ